MRYLAMEPNEDLIHVLGFQLDLMRLAMAPQVSVTGDEELPEAEELERMLERVPSRYH